MTPEESTSLLHHTVASVLGVSESAVSDDSSPDTIPQWDSVAHLNLIMAVEEAFGVTFSPEEVMEMTSVRLISLVLAEKQA